MLSPKKLAAQHQTLSAAAAAAAAPHRPFVARNLHASRCTPTTTTATAAAAAASFGDAAAHCTTTTMDAQQPAHAKGDGVTAKPPPARDDGSKLPHSKQRQQQRAAPRSDQTPQSDQINGGGSNGDATTTTTTAAAAAAAAGPSPDVYAGPPRVPDAEDCPLPRSWVRSLPPADLPVGGVGRIHVVMGPMFAGKSTALLDHVRAPWGGLRVVGALRAWGRVSAVEVESKNRCSYRGESAVLNYCASRPHPAAHRRTINLNKNAPHSTTPHPQQVKAQEAAGRRVAVVKSAVDTRYARAWVVTHDGRRARCFTAPTLGAFKEEMGELLGRFHVSVAVAGVGWRVVVVGNGGAGGGLLLAVGACCLSVHLTHSPLSQPHFAQPPTPTHPPPTPNHPPGGGHR